MRPQFSLAHSPDVQLKSRIANPVSFPQTFRPQAPASLAPGQFDSDSLLGGAREVLIRHGGEVYRLRHTRNDKLILTK
ncbi:hemin uptake protein HemP [Lysobacter sp. A378]